MITSKLCAKCAEGMDGMDSSGGKFVHNHRRQLSQNVSKPSKNEQMIQRHGNRRPMICPHPYGATLNSVTPHIGLQGTLHPWAQLPHWLFPKWSQSLGTPFCLCIQNSLPFQRHWGMKDNCVAASSVNEDNSTIIASNNVCWETNFIHQPRCGWFCTAQSTKKFAA